MTHCDTRFIRCKGCGLSPDQLSEYRHAAADLAIDTDRTVTPTDYVVQEEGTYNPDTGLFYCTNCMIELEARTGKRFLGKA